MPSPILNLKEKKMLNTIAFDLDGTLIDLMSVAIPLVEKYAGVPITKFTQFDIAKDNNISKKAVWQGILEAINHRNIPVYEGVKTLFRNIYDITGEPIKIVTARPANKEQQTFFTVMSFTGDTPFRIKMVNPEESKMTYLDGYDYFVEDRRRTALELADAGIYVFLIRKPYNQGVQHSKIEYIDGVKDLIDREWSFVNLPYMEYAINL